MGVDFFRDFFIVFLGLFFVGDLILEVFCEVLLICLIFVILLLLLRFFFGEELVDEELELVCFGGRFGFFGRFFVCFCFDCLSEELY